MSYDGLGAIDYSTLFSSAAAGAPAGPVGVAAGVATTVASGLLSSIDPYGRIYNHGGCPGQPTAQVQWLLDNADLVDLVRWERYWTHHPLGRDYSSLPDPRQADARDIAQALVGGSKCGPFNPSAWTGGFGTIARSLFEKYAAQMGSGATSGPRANLPMSPADTVATAFATGAGAAAGQLAQAAANTPGGQALQRNVTQQVATQQARAAVPWVVGAGLGVAVLVAVVRGR